jgi:hypothetical protein
MKNGSPIENNRVLRSHIVGLPGLRQLELVRERRSKKVDRNQREQEYVYCRLRPQAEPLA